MRALIASEFQEAVALIDWTKVVMSRHPELRWFHAIPNGEKRDPRLAAKLKAAGVKAGVADYFLPAPRGEFSGLYIELKRLRGAYPSPDQREFLTDMQAAGYRAKVCHGWEAAKAEIEGYLALPAK